MKSILLLLAVLIAPIKLFAHGAIANCDSPQTEMAMSWEADSIEEAKTEALKHCKNSGTIIDKAMFNNSCAAVAIDSSSGIYGWASGYNNESLALDAAISTCKKSGGTSCNSNIKHCDKPKNSNSPIYQQSNGESQCSQYGFQKGTDAFAQCLMQVDIAQRQVNAERQARANRENSCQMAKANAYLQPTRTGNFFESQQLADQTYNNCMAGLPPPKVASQIVV